ncbi:MAG: putative DNA ligase [Candidatus Woesebacteria bacterium GW2011_GWE1_45_18]|uniref:Probable DNA ligase n=1 Tax=Candidatus Woesebacteria bacterium GW2011_GWE1_45_18 TaxID=1618598 RepID=A0A0G1M6E3_9BACT|nr:MAG: putative DNA ligase [Candidatus Woesebacteria bacterium GW2011_GWE1_45_18]
MRFRELAVYLEKLEKTSSRNEITQILADLFKKSHPSEIDKIVYLVSGELAPKFKGVVFNIAERLMMQIIARAYDVKVEDVRVAFKEKGDLGLVAGSFAKEKGGNVEVSEVFARMLAIAEEGGGGSQERKITKTAELFSSLDPLSVRFVARIPVGKLRLGFSDMTILDALSVMVRGDKSARPLVEGAFNVSVDIGKIAKRVKERGLSGLKGVAPEPGTPIRPSLAERLPSAEKILEKVGEKVAIEPKYDGFRAMVNIWEEAGEKKVVIFSRNLENTTHMFPDLVDAVKKIKVKSAIFDAEAIGYDLKTGKFLPFQETVQRKRKHDIEEIAKRLPLKLFIFDILYKDGKSFLNTPFGERRKILESTVGKVDGKIELTRQEIVDSPEEIKRLQKEYLAEGLEGALIKKIDATYKAGARGYHWVKYKKTTEGGLTDTIDCLVMGINKGKGKRAGFGAGAFLVGVRSREKFKTVSKIGTGLTDEQWRELNERSKKLQVKEKPKEYEVDKNQEPDTWVRPSLVVEILADEITRSPIHTAGLALRFPRLIRFRDEKNPDQVTTLRELEGLFEMQKR